MIRESSDSFKREHQIATTVPHCYGWLQCVLLHKDKKWNTKMMWNQADVRSDLDK